MYRCKICGVTSIEEDNFFKHLREAHNLEPVNFIDLLAFYQIVEEDK